MPPKLTGLTAFLRSRVHIVPIPMCDYSYMIDWCETALGDELTLYVEKFDGRIMLSRDTWYEFSDTSEIGFVSETMKDCFLKEFPWHVVLLSDPMTPDGTSGLRGVRS